MTDAAPWSNPEQGARRTSKRVVIRETRRRNCAGRVVERVAPPGAL